jgi:biopolymer transport protein TolQ
MDTISAGGLGAGDFSALAVFLRADWVVKGVLIGLALASIWSWTVIIDKFFRIGALNRQADQFESAVSSGRSLEDIAADAGERPRHALPRMLQAALREWREGRARGAATPGAEGVALLISRIDRVLDSIQHPVDA